MPIQTLRNAPPMMGRVKRTDAANKVIVAVVVLTFFGALSSPEPWMVFLSGVCLIGLILILWRGDEPPILLFPVALQWSEVAIVPISTVWLGKTMQELSLYESQLDGAATYGFLGLTAMAIGIRLGAGNETKSAENFSERIEKAARTLPFAKIIFVAMTLIGAGYSLAFLSAVAGPLREPLGQASSIKYVGLFMLTYCCLIRNQGYGILLSVVSFEIIFGMTGFFAAFKDSVLTFFVAALFARPRIRLSDVLVISFFAGLIIFIGIFWSAVKPEYRAFVNKGTGAQVVVVPLADRLEFLGDAVMSLDGTKISDGFERLVNRHGYIDYLALVLTNVPRVMPHEKGALTVAVFRHISVPRFLWPGKPVLPNDTEVMSKYTGLPMVWGDETSISIGYLGEMYVDFGYFGGIAAAGVMGIAFGFAYRFLRSQRNTSAILLAGLAMMMSLKIGAFGTAYVKTAGAFVLAAVIVAILAKFVFPHLLRGEQTVAKRGPSPAII